MELKPGLSAFVTGGASGIGRALCIALAQKGVFVTVVDFSEERGKEVASLSQNENLKFHSGLKFPSAIFVRCDVSNKGEIAAAFENHLEVYGGLDICINCAGISTPAVFQKDQTDGSRTWRHAIDVNLVAVIDCTHRAIRIMEAAKRPGVVINIGSASGLYPMITDPIYSASKGGVVMFTRSLAPYKRKGIRINVLCPEFVRTDLAEKVDSKFIERMGGYVSMDTVIQGTFELISDESKAGSTVHTLNHNFRSATSIVRAPLRLPIKPNHVLLKIIYAGVNASDVNFSSGSYFSGSKQEISSRLPFDAGFEGVGLIAAVGDGVKNLKVGSPAAIMTFGAYAEFTMAAQMESGKIVLVTAAAGGTGQFAVQLAKLAGNKVVATCGGKDKAMLLRDLGVDRVIDYKEEVIKNVLKKEFPKGVDIVYESVGGEMFDLCFNALAVYGRMVVIGMISQYQGEHGWKPRNYTGLCEKLLAKSQTVAGFFLTQYTHLWQQHLDSLVHLFSVGKLKVAIDPKSFVGVQSVADAVEYLHSGKSVGKVVVCIDPSFSQQAAKL
ncbi:Alcohol dehydrogenase, C-terminal [Cynara cardunculus var. scolymus]|uniref:Alcohol dehydrogenase, C-terminal n=1 Tax=Cynara cardunculus var. scolymus TaxID=59895 RepID=A0A103YKK8_CYNCS|nr:Alcohol dehydrogenase, C-terminal [Cynara cardunculus var. scolymus]